MESSLRKLKKKVKELKNKNVPYIEDIEFLREYISQEAYEDVKANFIDHTIIYDRLQKSTLEEMNKKILIVGSGPRDTVILIDDIDQMED
mgnify:CR=1 FL=1